MIIKHNGQDVTLPDIPEKLLAEYQYAVIGHNTGGGFYLLIMSYDKFVHRYLSDTSQVVVSPEEGFGTRTVEDGIGGLVWNHAESIESGVIPEEGKFAAGEGGVSLSNDDCSGPIEFLWANHDIYDFEPGDPIIVLDDLWYFSDSISHKNVYVVPSDWIVSMAEQARRLTGENKRYTTDGMLEVFEGVYPGEVSSVEGVKF